MAENRVVSTSTMEIGSSSAENVQEAKGEGSDIGDSILANTILVPNDIENDKEKTTDIPNLKNLAASRMEIIRQSMEKQNLDLTTINHLQHKHRKETINNYNRNWERWANWCSQQSPTINYLEYAPKNVLKYLVQNRHYSTSHLNGIRSSIASVFNVVYPSKPSIGQHHLIQDFFTAHKKQRVQIPTREEIEIWDLDILLKFIKAKYAHNDRLTIMELQYKTVLLLSIFTMWRPKSDISRLQHRDVLFQTENGRIQGVTLICRLPKEAQQKTISLGTIDTSDLCPVTTLYLFIQKTEGYRGKLPENQTLFLAYINEQKPTSCVSPNTVTGWIKNNMSQAGIDTTKYQPHSIRSAASTKAVQLGFKIDDVKKHANWSLNSNTFEKYYYKPNHTDRISTAIGNSMVNNLSENNTISGVRTEATSIGVGTTCNTDVAVVRTEDMRGSESPLPYLPSSLRQRPYFRRSQKEFQRVSLFYWTKSFLFDDNAKPYTAKMTQKHLHDVGFEALPHPAYSADLSPTDYHFFCALENHIMGKTYRTREEVISAFEGFLEAQPLNFYDKGINGLPLKWQKCVDSDGTYFE
ncbi:hypothetical protein G6F29_007590 [Rhizopus arrhizus]|nr:hypothetical protein G6F29_007590 [Rhizopus arrhizus]